MANAHSGMISGSEKENQYGKIGMNQALLFSLSTQFTAIIRIIIYQNYIRYQFSTFVDSLQ